MQIIANFRYAGTEKYVSHAIENDHTLCGMSVDDLFARRGQEWDYVDEEEYLNITHKHQARDVGCLKCRRLLTQLAPDLLIESYAQQPRVLDAAYCTFEFVQSQFGNQCAVCRKPPRQAVAQVVNC